MISPRLPFVSVIPALNEENGIEATLESVRHQDYAGKIELIVADGNSTDRTVAISRKHADKVVTETTRTIAAGRQVGSRAASGEILLYTDADTLVDKAWVRKMAAAFDDQRVVAAFGEIRPIEGNVVEKALLSAMVFFLAWTCNRLGADYTYGNNMGMRKRVFDRIGGFNIYLVTGEDTDIVKRLRKEGRVVFVPGALAYYSIRRIREWGYPKYIWFHTKNFFMSQVLHAPAGHYEPIRK